MAEPLHRRHHCSAVSCWIRKSSAAARVSPNSKSRMIAACEAAALGARPRTGATRSASMGPGDLAPLPRRRHAAGSDLRPAHAPSSPGNRPARTADDTADHCLISRHGAFTGPLPCPVTAAPEAPNRPRPQAHEPSADANPGKARPASTQHTGGRAGASITHPSYSPPLPLGACPADPSDRWSTTARDTDRRIREAAFRAFLRPGQRGGLSGRADGRDRTRRGRHGAVSWGRRHEAGQAGNQPLEQ